MALLHLAGKYFKVLSVNILTCVSMTQCISVKIFLNGTNKTQPLERYGMGDLEILNTINRTKNQRQSDMKDGFDPGLVILVVFLSTVLLFLIVTLALPMTTQNSLFWCCLKDNDNHFSYIDVALYKTRHSMYRKEIYSTQMRKKLKTTDEETNPLPENLPIQTDEPDGKNNSFQKEKDSSIALRPIHKSPLKTTKFSLCNSRENLFSYEETPDPPKETSRSILINKKLFKKGKTKVCFVQSQSTDSNNLPTPCEPVEDQLVMPAIVKMEAVVTISEGDLSSLSSIPEEIGLADSPDCREASYESLDIQRDMENGHNELSPSLLMSQMRHFQHHNSEQYRSESCLYLPLRGHENCPECQAGIFPPLSHFSKHSPKEMSPLISRETKHNSFNT